MTLRDALTTFGIVLGMLAAIYFFYEAFNRALGLDYYLNAMVYWSKVLLFSAVTAGVGIMAHLQTLDNPAPETQEKTPESSGIVYLDKLMIDLGKRKDSGKKMVVDIFKFPHAFIGGATGGGKSNTFHQLLLQIMRQSTPDQIGIIVADPKQIEFGVYGKCAHLICPVLVDEAGTVEAFAWVHAEMKRRYELIGEFSERDDVMIRSLSAFNKRYPAYAMRQIIVMIDEYHCLQEYDAVDELNKYTRELVALSRASGIHVLMFTQQLKKDSIPSNILANIPVKMAHKTVDAVESRQIIAVNDAEDLPGPGALLVRGIGAEGIVQTQVPFIEDDAIMSRIKGLKRKYPLTKYPRTPFSEALVIPGQEVTKVTANAETLLLDKIYAWVRSMPSGTAVTRKRLQTEFSLSEGQAKRFYDDLKVSALTKEQHGSTARYMTP